LNARQEASFNAFLTAILLPIKSGWELKLKLSDLNKVIFSTSRSSLALQHFFQWPTQRPAQNLGQGKIAVFLASIKVRRK
jgi:hypothetical protein